MSAPPPPPLCPVVNPLNGPFGHHLFVEEPVSLLEKTPSVWVREAKTNPSNSSIRASRPPPQSPAHVGLGLSGHGCLFTPPGLILTHDGPLGWRLTALDPRRGRPIPPWALVAEWSATAAPTRGGLTRGGLTRGV